MHENEIRRYINDRYGNFPGTVQDEMLGIIRDFLERIRSNSGGHLVIRTERNTSYTTPGIPGQYGSSQFIPGSERSWLIGTIIGQPDVFGGETLSFVLENLLEGECVCIPEYRYDVEYTAMPVDQDIVSRIAQEYIDTSVLLLAQENRDRLKGEWRSYRGTEAKLLVGDQEIGVWIDNPQNDHSMLLELISLLGLTLECDSERYREWIERQRRLGELEALYRQGYPHIRAVAALVQAIKGDRGLEARLLSDLGIKG